MERDMNCDIAEDKCEPHDETAISSFNFFLDLVGEVTLTFNSDGLSWEALEPFSVDTSTCLGRKHISNAAKGIIFSDIYAADFIDYGLIHSSPVSRSLKDLSGDDVKMYRFVVYGALRNEVQPSLLIPVKYTFGNNNRQTCQMWVNKLNDSLNLKVERPKSLMVFVHPRSGKGLGCRTWETVAPIFSRAKVKTKVVVTERARQAFDMMSSMTNRELNSYNGVIAVGGDGFFNEILNGFLSPRLKAPLPPAPSDLVHLAKDSHGSLDHDGNETAEESAKQSEEQSPLISCPEQIGSRISNSNSADQDPEFRILNERLRFGIIPAGSTDAIVMCTTGSRDPMTSALHIVLGKRVHLDIAQVVRWKETPKSAVEPCVRFAASFAGYGFYGDVITESEKYRWMGPKRYDYAGTMVFLKHRSYEAEIHYLEGDSNRCTPTSKGNNQGSKVREKRSMHKPERCICRVNCEVCMASHMTPGNSHPTPYLSTENSKWQRCEGRFLSVGAAVISCRNEKAPDGLVADAHLSDGFLHLILIKDCPHAYYLWHLTQLARRGGNPFNFKFVEHHKTRAFTFTSLGNESVWNVDGEPFQAHQLSAQVFHGLVSLFASGPEV